DIRNSARYQSELRDLFTALTETVREYERGNFDATVAFDPTDSLLDEELLQIVDDIEAMGAEIGQHVEKVQSDVDRLSATARTITDRSQEIDTVSTEQADSMETISGEISNLSATVEEIASTAEGVSETSARAADVADEGTEAAHEALDEMEGVAESADTVADDVETLQSRVADIDEVVEVINDIAEQTNILALNASIEAARAGEAGDGFAVVADEVKNLAEESQQHAGRIEETV
ncbi:MAG: methyl-accepting chemotaxis protein, partial [Halobaculum sp.]